MSFKWLFFDSLGFVWSLYLSDARFVHPCQQAAIKFLLHMCMCISPTPSVNALAFQKSGVYHQVARLCLIHSFSSIFGLFIHESFGCQDIQFLLKLFWGLQSPPQPVVLNIYVHIYISSFRNFWHFFHISKKNSNCASLPWSEVVCARFVFLSAFKVSAGIHRDCGEECVVFVFGTQLFLLVWDFQRHCDRWDWWDAVL